MKEKWQWLGAALLIAAVIGLRLAISAANASSKTAVATRTSAKSGEKKEFAAIDDSGIAAGDTLNIIALSTQTFSGCGVYKKEYDVMISSGTPIVTIAVSTGTTLSGSIKVKSTAGSPCSHYRGFSYQ